MPSELAKSLANALKLPEDSLLAEGFSILLEKSQKLELVNKQGTLSDDLKPEIKDKPTVLVKKNAK